jgi:hypothetical protein
MRRGGSRRIQHACSSYEDVVRNSIGSGILLFKSRVRTNKDGVEHLGNVIGIPCLRELVETHNKYGVFESLTVSITLSKTVMIALKSFESSSSISLATECFSSASTDAFCTFPSARSALVATRIKSLP